jgi:hypothetical protein
VSELVARLPRVKRRRRRRLPPWAWVILVMFATALAAVGAAVWFLSTRDLPRGDGRWIVFDLVMLVTAGWLARDWWPEVRAIVRYWRGE